jgi:hypothetical protein
MIEMVWGFRRARDASQVRAARETVRNGTQQRGCDTVARISICKALIRLILLITRTLAKTQIRMLGIGGASPTRLRQRGGQWPVRQMCVGMNTSLECVGCESATRLWLVGRNIDVRPV